VASGIVRLRSLLLLARFEDALGARLLVGGLFLRRRAARKRACEQQSADREDPQP
jgi:hypothetical protein